MVELVLVTRKRFEKDTVSGRRKTTDWKGRRDNFDKKRSNENELKNLGGAGKEMKPEVGKIRREEDDMMKIQEAIKHFEVSNFTLDLLEQKTIRKLEVFIC
ncbi:hypothetical protein RUM43_006758 [Polyplax serrata]|uniref:Uncharacterized protein n=1 Tax=Polyplax serrata TaxID=468196 RepID=A0AAN8SA21_POLSC